jgi:putative CocE/NonD family hydrolase
VLIRTPYRTEMQAFEGRLLAEGYAVVQQHERGRFLSEGEPRMLSYAAQDGWDTLDWIAKQSWSDGKVATMGCSSSAENQLKLATLGHPAHKAMIAYSAGVGVAEAGPFREQGNFWRGGAWQQGWTDYFLSETAKDWPQLPAGMSDEDRQRASSWFSVDNETPKGSAKALEASRMHLPMIDISKAANAPHNELESYLARGPVNDAWDDDRVTNADIIKVPGLWAEALNTNAKRYGGGGEGHLEPVKTQAVKWDGRPHAVDLTLPGMSVMFFLFKPATVEKEAGKNVPK